MDQDREERIRARAYEIWERKDRQEGSHEAHWRQAEQELQNEESGLEQGTGSSSKEDLLSDKKSSVSPDKASS